MTSSPARAEEVDRGQAGNHVRRRLGNFNIAAPILKKLGLPATFFVITGYIGTDTVARWDRQLPAPPRWMTWDQVWKQLDQEGLQIGAHTQTHIDLGVVDGDDADCEIRGSRQDLEERLGHDVTLFAYPFGGRRNITEANRERIKNAGFRCCVSCHGGLAQPNDGGSSSSSPRCVVVRYPEQFAFEVLLRSSIDATLSFLCTGAGVGGRARRYGLR